MLKVFIGLAMFVWAFYSYSACTQVQTSIQESTKLFKSLNQNVPLLTSSHLERTGKLLNAYLIEKCPKTLTVRFQSKMRQLSTGKTLSQKFFCKAKLRADFSLISSKCLAPEQGNESGENTAPRAYPYDDAADPFNSSASSGGPLFGDDEPDFPERSGENPDSIDDLAF